METWAVVTIDDFARDLLSSALIDILSDISLSANDLPLIQYIQIATETIGRFENELSEDLEQLFKNSYDLVRGSENDFIGYVEKYCGSVCKSHIYYDWIFVCTFVVHLIRYSASSRGCFRFLDRAKKCLISLFHAKFIPEFFGIGGWPGFRIFCYAANILDLATKPLDSKSGDNSEKKEQYIWNTANYYKLILEEKMKIIKDDEFNMRIALENDADSSKIRDTDSACSIYNTAEDNASSMYTTAEDDASSMYTTAEEDTGRVHVVNGDYEDKKQTSAEGDPDNSQTTYGTTNTQIITEDSASSTKNIDKADLTRVKAVLLQMAEMVTNLQDARFMKTVDKDYLSNRHTTDKDPTNSRHTLVKGSISNRQTTLVKGNISSRQTTSVKDDIGNLQSVVEYDEVSEKIIPNCEDVNNANDTRKEKKKSRRKKKQFKKVDSSVNLESKKLLKNSAENNLLKMNILTCKWCAEKCLKRLDICINLYRRQYFSYMESVRENCF